MKPANPSVRIERAQISYDTSGVLSGSLSAADDHGKARRFYGVKL
jgi:hypothetical protein